MGTLEPISREVCLDGAQSVAETGRLDPLPRDLHHPGRRVGHDHGADPVGEQDAQPTGATADVDRAHPRTEVHGLGNGPGHRHLPLLVAGVVVPGGGRVVESLVLVHVTDPNPGPVPAILTEPSEKPSCARGPRLQHRPGQGIDRSINK